MVTVTRIDGAAWRGDWASRAFWARFGREHWERRPLAADGVLAPPCAADELFDVVVRAVGDPAVPRLGAIELARVHLARRLGRHLRPPGVMARFAIGRRSSWRVPARFRPRRSDGGFVGYHERVIRELGRGFGAIGQPRRYALIVNNPELISPRLYRWAREVVAPLYGAVGMNNGGNYLALFIGNYLRTPFGVHWDPESVFSVPIVGRKVVRTWPSDAPSLPAIRHRVAYPTAGSQRLEASPGGVIYWPSDAWHCAESDGELSVSIAVSLTHRYPAGGDPRAAMVPFAPADAVTVARTVPRQLDLRDRIGDGELTATGVRAEWLRRVTSLGYLQTPPVAAARRPPAASLVAARPGAIAWIDEDPAMVLVGAMGHLRRWPQEVVGVLEPLAAGGRHELRSLLARAAAPATADELVTWLIRAGALITAEEVA